MAPLSPMAPLFPSRRRRCCWCRGSRRSGCCGGARRSARPPQPRVHLVPRPRAGAVAPERRRRSVRLLVVGLGLLLAACALPATPPADERGSAAGPVLRIEAVPHTARLTD